MTVMYNIVREFLKMKNEEITWFAVVFSLLVVKIMVLEHTSLCEL